MSAIHALSPDKLARLVDTPACPILIDVRTDEDFKVDSRFIPSAIRRRHTDVASRGGNRVLQALHRIVALFLLLLPIDATAVAGAQPEVIDLSLQQTGTPQPFAFWSAGEADGQHWSIVRETAGSTASIQCAGGNRTSAPALAIYAPFAATNVKVRMRFRLVDGMTPSAGLAVRVTSPDDYYLVRVSASEARLSFVHVVRGHPDEIAGVDADIARDHWQTLEVTAFGDGFKISLDDQWALTAFDRDSLVSGRIALWSEKDTVARFEGIEITPLAVLNGSLVGG